MRDPLKICLTDEAVDARLIRVVRARPDWDDVLGGHAAYLRESGFRGDAGDVALLPGAQGVAEAVIVVSDDGRRDPCVFGGLAHRLPDGNWRLVFEEALAARAPTLAEDAVLGFCMGAYSFHLPEAPPASVRLVCPEGTEDAVRLARANWLGRDLINMPANLLGPDELAFRAGSALREAGADVEIFQDGMLEEAYPCLGAVGAGSDRSPRVLVARWSGSRASGDAPLISLVGKGVCFDSGGYDIKPSAGMLRMKKDMGGAALMLAVALVTIGRDLPVRLELRLGCVENSVSGHAMRPGDILKTRAGLSVEIGNTDAEGRLVLCDLLAEACEADPDWLIDAATLTGAARIALGPDLPALFANDDSLCEALISAGKERRDDLWRLPLWHAYDAWLDRKVADIGNVTEKPGAGAITAALFLARFVKEGIKWAHLDTYAWNDAQSPGRPQGGETPALRAVADALLRIV